MADDLVTLRDNIVNLLDKNNTTGSSYDLSSGLRRRVAEIRPGSPKLGQISAMLPCVFVRIGRYKAELNLGGANAQRDVDYEVNMYAVTNALAGQDRSEADEECMRLSQNILNVIRAYPDMSMSGHWVSEIEAEMPDTTTQFGPEGSGIRMNPILLTCHTLV
jgi:hypothetical protein